MRIVILTSFLKGTAAYHLPSILENTNVSVTMVVYSEGIVLNKKKMYAKKIRKVFKIGLLGAINGLRMRRWFNNDIEQYCKIDNIENICEKHDIPFYKVSSTNSKETQQLFKDANADLGISLGNGYIGSKVFNIPKYGMINIHHEILPNYQNAQSIIWQLYNGSTNTGYTIHLITSKIDEGNIVYQKIVPIGFKETLPATIAFTSYKLLEASAEGLIATLNHFNEFFDNAKPQGEGQSYTTPSYWQYLKIKKQHDILKKMSFLKA